MRTFEAAQQDAAHAASCPRRGFSVSLAFPSLRRLFRRLARLLRGLLLRGGPLRRSPLGSGFPGRFSLRRGLPRGFLLRGLLFPGDLLLLGRRLLPRRSLGRRSRWLQSGRRWRLRGRRNRWLQSGRGWRLRDRRSRWLRSRCGSCGRGSSGFRRHLRSGCRRGLRRDRGARCPEHLLGVVLGVDLVEDVANSPVLAHEERLAQRTDSPRWIRVLAPCAIRLMDGVIGIRQELERQVVLGSERIVRRGVVARDSEDLDPGALQLAPGVAQAARLARASGSCLLYTSP